MNHTLIPNKETGFCFDYSVEKTLDKGLGVFAREPIEKGSVVWRHVPGTFEVYDEFSFRDKIKSMSPADVVHELTHVHALDDFPGCLILALDDGALVNHSREPTLVTNNAAPASTLWDEKSPRYVQSVTESLPNDRYSLIAIRDIESGEEFTNDYTTEDEYPAFYDTLYEEYEVREDYLNDE